jgi:hypothetical protein
MGTWHGSTTSDALYRLLDEVDPSYLLRSRTELIDKLKASGLIVEAPFYVPDMEELWGMKRKWSYYRAQGMEGARWVMCRETGEALARKYATTRTVTPFEFDGPDPREIGVVGRWDGNYTLFGVPVRIDPAARSPLFEIDTPATRRGPDRAEIEVER